MFKNFSLDSSDDQNHIDGEFAHIGDCPIKSWYFTYKVPFGIKTVMMSRNTKSIYTLDDISLRMESTLSV